MRVTASLDAGRFVRERGGQLYVWFQSLGPRSGWGRLRISITQPSGDQVGFEQIDTGAFELFLDTALPRPKALRVELEGRFRKRIRVRGLGEGYVAGDGGAVVFDSWGGGGDGGGGGGNGGGG